MMHSIKEIYESRLRKPMNFRCTLAYCQANNISIYSYRTNRGGEAHQLCTITTAGQFKYYDIDGMHIGYNYGQYVWFDTEEERDAYRTEQNIKIAAERARNKVKKAIIERLDQMTIEELEEVLKKI